MFAVFDSNGNRKTSAGGLTVPSMVADTSTGTVANWAPTLAGDTLIEWSGASDATFQGLSAGSYIGQLVTVKNTGSKVAYFAHLNGSTSLKQFSNLVTSGVTPVAARGFITYAWDGTNWVLISHEQGAWITPTFSSGRFTGAGSMTWTVASVSAERFRISGATLFYALSAFGTSVGGTPSLQLQVTLPNSYSIQSDLRSTFPGTDNGTIINGLLRAVPATSIVQLFRDSGGATNWALSTSNTNVEFVTFMELS